MYEPCQICKGVTYTMSVRPKTNGLTGLAYEVARACVTCRKVFLTNKSFTVYDANALTEDKMVEIKESRKVKSKK